LLDIEVKQIEPTKTHLKRETMKGTTQVRNASIGCAILLFILAIIGHSLGADGVTGLGDTHHHSEYLFGYSGFNANTLTVNASTVLDTGTSEFYSGSRNQGWWSPSAFNVEFNDNYIVGDLSSNGSQLYNDFFTFDISGLTGPVSSAVLNLQRFYGGSDLGRTTQTYDLYDVSTDAATLNANNGTSAAIYNDLGSGNLYGSYSLPVAGNPSDIIDLTLDAAALSDLNAAIARGDQYFSIGGTLAPSESVPEVGSTLALLGISLGFLSFLRRVRTR
jgi:hypothetical protein